LPDGVETKDVVEVALGRWTDDAPSPKPLATQPVTLAVMLGDRDRARSLADELVGPVMGPAMVAVLACQPDAQQLLDMASEQDRRGELYWALVERQSALDGEPDARAARLLEIMTGMPNAAYWVDQDLNPLDENGRGYTTDLWGYRRMPVEWPSYAVLPDPEAGIARWRIEPEEAVRAGELEAEMPDCLGSGG
jgi:hypothetical protein